ncbi:MAG: hypothetical protein IKV13_02400 [Akkermansia sp.]|nr:hypothetical protein [Akkermansia sp.]
MARPVHSRLNQGCCTAHQASMLSTNAASITHNTPEYRLFWATYTPAT